MSRSGYTLLEMLIVLGLLSILSSIAVIQYRDSRQDTEKRNLKDSALLYATKIETCISVVGGWTKYQGLCKEVSPTTPGTLSKQPSSKLKYTCPSGATCEFWSYDHTTSTDDTLRYHCLSIKTEVSGKKLQVITLIPYDNPSDYEIWCGEVSGTYQDIGTTCLKANGYNTSGFKKDGECWKQDP